jgi:hypothetical protein
MARFASYARMFSLSVWVRRENHVILGNTAAPALDRKAGLAGTTNVVTIGETGQSVPQPLLDQTWHDRVVR